MANLDVKPDGSTTDDANVSDENSLWYERSDTDDADNETEEESEVIEREEPDECIESSERICESPVLDMHAGKSYPHDVWCLLSSYIKPEQIRTYAGICRGAYESVNSVRFWICLYKTFIPDTACLPDRLKPGWIGSRPGLKMRTVRALFIGYEKLRNRLLRENMAGIRNTHSVSQLVGLSCCLMWYKSGSEKPIYTFYFKFKLSRNKMVADGLVSSVFDNDDYLTRNDERYFVILQISVNNFIRLDSVCGETLTDVSVNLSGNMRHNRVKLVFHCFRKDGRYRKCDGTTMVLDPVCELCLLRWWHPTYPHYDE